MEHMPHVLFYFWGGVLAHQAWKWLRWARAGRNSPLTYVAEHWRRIGMGFIVDGLGFLAHLAGVLVPLVLWILPDSMPPEIREIMTVQSVDLLAPLLGVTLDVIGCGFLEAVTRRAESALPARAAGGE